MIGVVVRQVLVIPDFPSPALARVMSPNGTAHWRDKQRAAAQIVEYLKVAVLMRVVPLTPMAPPVHATYRWIVPDRRHRDIDNHHGSRVVKVVQDWLVARGVLPAGDHSTVLTSHTEIVYEKGQRRMEIVLTPAAEGQAAQGGG